MPSTAKIKPGKDHGGIETTRLYDHRFSADVKRQKRAVWEVIVKTFLQRWIPNGAHILDLGCGYGEFLNHVEGARRLGVDTNPEVVDYLDPNIEFRCGDVCDLSFLDDASIDVVFTSNLLEHLGEKANVERLIREASRVLKPGGHFIAMGPNMRFLPGVYWDYWDHSVAITDRSLVEVLEYLGLRVIDCFPQFLPYTVKSKYPKTPFLVRLYLRVPLAWKFMGRQFLIRAQK